MLNALRYAQNFYIQEVKLVGAANVKSAKITPHDDFYYFRAENRLCFPRLPQGANGFRTHPDPALG